MKNSTKITIAIIATITLVGCGGGSSDDYVGGGDSGSNNEYRGYVPLTDNPTSFTCSTSDSLSGKKAISYSGTKSECEEKTQAWLNEFNQDDTPRTQEQVDALAWLNMVREGTGLPTFKHNQKLEQATFNHENYIGDVKDTYNVRIAHYEDNDNYPSQHYTGITPTDRAKYTGYEGWWAGDVISSGGANVIAKVSIMGLMTAIYHRQALLWDYTNEIGIGGVERNYNFRSYPHLMGSKTDRNSFLEAISPAMVFYPFANQTEVQTTFDNHENPDPLPDTDEWVGNPISVTFNDYHVSSVEMLSFKLYNGDEEITDVTYMDKDTDPNSRFTEFEFALFPMQILSNDTEYRVEIKYVQDGKELSKIWSFKTVSEVE